MNYIEYGHFFEILDFKKNSKQINAKNTKNPNWSRSTEVRTRYTGKKIAYERLAT